MTNIRDEAARRAAGDGEVVSVTETRGARRTGRAIWILVVSLGLAVVLLIGYFAVTAGRMKSTATVNSGGGQGQVTAAARTFNTQPPSPKRAPPGEASTSGAATNEVQPSAGR